jgi:hypothetical protein
LHLRFVIFHWTSISITARVTFPHKKVTKDGRLNRYSQTPQPLLW